MGYATKPTGLTSEAAMEEGWVQAGEVRAHYMAAGKGPPLVLLHGGANDWREWKPNIEPLGQSFRVYAPDLVGFGLSDRPRADYSLDYFVKFLSSFLEALAIDRASLMGHSMGGAIALSFALRFPTRVRKLVLVDSSGLGADITPLGWLIIAISAGWKWLRGKPTYPLAARTDQATRRKQRLMLLEQLPCLEVPTLILWGKRDPYFPASQAYLAHHLIPRSRLHIFSGCRHAPQRERSKEFNRLVLDFLREEGSQ